MGDAPATARRAPGSLAGWAGSIARRPAVPTAALFMAGIAAHRTAPAAPAAWLAVMAVLLVAAWRLPHRMAWSSAALALAAALGGLCAAQLFAFYYPRNHVSAYTAPDARLAQLELYIEQPPHVLGNPFD